MSAYAIVCADYEREFSSREAAEHQLESIEASGHCPNEHTIEERE